MAFLLGCPAYSMPTPVVPLLAVVITGSTSKCRVGTHVARIATWSCILGHNVHTILCSKPANLPCSNLAKADLRCVAPWQSVWPSRFGRVKTLQPATDLAPDRGLFFG